MERKDFSAIAQRLTTNGVSFVKLFFKTSHTPEEINDVNGPKEFIADFSDGMHYLGSLTIPTQRMADMSPDWKVPQFEMSCYGVTAPELAEEMKIVFQYSCPYARGECTIELDDSYDSFK